ncbi:MAG TPA: hypothetical protein DIV46_10305 [Verrucomicrobiales bacterium]|nr:hypothetical protein [Verrucomicrobiales bacterium]
MLATNLTLEISKKAGSFTGQRTSYLSLKTFTLPSQNIEDYYKKEKTRSLSPKTFLNRSVLITVT